MNKSNKKINVLITGAAGNLGELLALYLQNDPSINLVLMIHKKDVCNELKTDPKIKIFRADLAKKDTLMPALENIDVVVHFAGVLFMPHPEKFFPITDVLYFKNLLDVSMEKKVKKVISINFPHVEGETFPERPAEGSLNKAPISMHAATRLEVEKYLFSKNNNNFKPVSLRVGMVYGKGILMLDAAKWLLKRRLLGVWRTPTWIHLISKDDLLAALKNAIVKPDIRGIYHIGDEGVQTLQEFLDSLAEFWGYKRPWRLPKYAVYFVAICSEIISMIFGTRSPLTRDFIKLGMVSYYGDTTRMKKDLLKELKYKSYKEGLSIL